MGGGGGADLPVGRARTAGEQESRRQQLTTQRGALEREQKELAKRRQACLVQQAALGTQIDAVADGTDSKSLARAERLSQQYAALGKEEAALASRIVKLQLDMDSIDASIRSMAVVHGCLAREPTSACSASSATAAAKLGAREARLLEKEVLEGAHIVFCTLSGAGEAMRLAEVSGGFETVVFDEAAQASELSTLIPLQYGAKRVILVGKPQQLTMCPSPPSSYLHTCSLTITKRHFPPPTSSAGGRSAAAARHRGLDGRSEARVRGVAL